MSRRFELADTIIWVDFPLQVHLWWVAKRQLKSFLGRDDAPPGCSYWRVTVRMFRLIWHIHRTMRPQLRALIEAGAAKGGGQVIRLTSPREWREFLAGVSATRVAP
jgi:adenylate kinase family enzyme